MFTSNYALGVTHDTASSEPSLTFLPSNNCCKEKLGPCLAYSISPRCVSLVKTQFHRKGEALNAIAANWNIIRSKAANSFRSDLA